MKTKNFFLNLASFVSLYIVVIFTLNLLFTVINAAYPPIASYNYYSSSSISWPVAMLIIFFPLMIVFMMLLARQYATNPEMQDSTTHRWLAYITLFLSGATIAGDLVTVLYYFLNGENLTGGFLLKVLAVLVITGGLFWFYLSDVTNKLTMGARKIWRIASTLIVIGSIVLGFAVTGSPFTQRAIRYDEQRISDLQNIDSQIRSYYQMKNVLPNTLSDISNSNTYNTLPDDPETNRPYEYTKLTNTTYNVCATFNTDSKQEINVPSGMPYYGQTWSHPAGHYCFSESINPPGTKLPM